MVFFIVVEEEDHTIHTYIIRRRTFYISSRHFCPLSFYPNAERLSGEFLSTEESSHLSSIISTGYLKEQGTCNYEGECYFKHGKTCYWKGARVLR